MPFEAPPKIRSREQGQLFAGWIVGIFIIAAMVVYVADTMRRARNGTQSTIYRELALNVAKAGFEDGMSFFRVHSTGTFLVGSAYAPTGQSPYVTPWPQYPDAAFMPEASDTDFYLPVATPLTPSGYCAQGIIRDITMNEFSGDVPNQITYSALSPEMHASILWGRYVVRRQNVQNWSPGPDTASANTDPDACHDLSAIAAQAALGSGTRWSIVSRGYLVSLPVPVTSYAASWLAQPAAFSGNCLLSAPLTFYQNQQFLMAQARVYGEISRINFNLADSAVETTQENNITLNTQGIINGTGGYAIAVALTGTAGLQGTCGTSCLTGSDSVTRTSAVSVGNVFPGQTWTSLQTMAAGYVNGTSIKGYLGTPTHDPLPLYNVASPAFIAQVNTPAFYFINSSLTLGPGEGQPVLSGVGLCIINGSLTIQAGSYSSWAGILYVGGTVTIDGPTSITGVLVCPNGISIGNANDLNKTTVAYSPGVIRSVEALLQDFSVISSSVVATQF